MIVKKTSLHNLSKFGVHVSGNSPDGGRHFRPCSLHLGGDLRVGTDGGNNLHEMIGCRQRNVVLGLEESEP